MGIDVLKLGNSDANTQLRLEDLGRVAFQRYTVPSPEMNIWLMAASKDKTLLPWWVYDSTIESGIRALNDVWSVATAQAFFDLLFLAALKQFAGRDFFVIFPGNIKSEGWGRLTESDRNVFLRGQGCIYHLQGAYSSKLTVNWVPFWQPQSLARDPSMGNFWRMFVANQCDDATNSISFFSLKDRKRLPDVINLLISQDDKRSEKLVGLVDWFGLYSSPLGEGYAPCSIIYSKSSEVMDSLVTAEKNFQILYDQAKVDLLSAPVPSTAIRILSRSVLL